MENFNLLFRKITGRNLSKRAVSYKSNDEIDETLFEAVSRLFFENRKAFYYLKEKALEAAKNEKNALILSTAGYFCYVDCDFKKAGDFFQKAINLQPEDLEQWLCLAFCLRQSGRENGFNNIVLNYKNIITEFINGKIKINKLSNKRHS